MRFACAVQSPSGSSCQRPANARITSSASRSGRSVPAETFACRGLSRAATTSSFQTSLQTTRTGDMMIHTEISPTELADRVAIRELVDAYAHCADRRDAEGQKSLFTEDTHFVVYMDGQSSEPTQ